MSSVYFGFFLRTLFAFFIVLLAACKSLPPPAASETNAVDYAKSIGDLIQYRHGRDVAARELDGYYIYDHKIRSILYSYTDVARKITEFCELTGGGFVEPNFTPVLHDSTQRYNLGGCRRPELGDFFFVLHFIGYGQNLEQDMTMLVVQSYEGEATEGFKRLAKANGFNW